MKAKADSAEKQAQDRVQRDKIKIKSKTTRNLEGKENKKRGALAKIIIKTEGGKARRKIYYV